MKRTIRVGVLAERDLIAIWEYSFLECNAGLADRYLGEIDHGIQALAENPRLGAARDCVRRGYAAPSSTVRR